MGTGVGYWNASAARNMDLSFQNYSFVQSVPVSEVWEEDDRGAFQTCEDLDLTKHLQQCSRTWNCELNKLFLA